MAAIRTTSPGAVPVGGTTTGPQESRSFREGSAAGLLVGVGAAVAALGLVIWIWWGGVGEVIATIGMLVLLPAAVLQAIIGLVDGVRDHDTAGESRSAAFGLLGFVAVLAALAVAVLFGL